MSHQDDKNDHQRPASRAGQAIILMSGLVSAAIVTLALSELQGILRPFFIAVFLCFLVKPLTTKLGRRLGIIGYAFAIALLLGLFSIADRFISADTSLFQEHYEKTYLPNVKKYQKSLNDSAILKRVFLHGEEKNTEQPTKGTKQEADSDSPEPNLVPNNPKAAGNAAKKSESEPKAVDHSVGNIILPLERIKKILNPETLTRVLGSGASFFFGIFGELVVVLVIMMLLLLESDLFPGRLKRVWGEEKGTRILEVFHEVGRSITRYVSLKVWISLLTSIICVVVMALFDLHYPITFGIIVFVFNFVPYLGSVVATLFPCLVALLQFSPMHAIWLGLALTAAQQVVGNVVEPRIQGKGLSISPVVIVLALGFWGWLWGIGGMILAVPITVTIRIVLEQFETTRRMAQMVGGDE